MWTSLASFPRGSAGSHSALPSASSKQSFVGMQIMLFCLCSFMVQAQEEDDNTATVDAELYNDNADWLRTAKFSPGIMMIFTAYIATVSATIGEFRAAVATVPAWNASTATLAQARHTIRKAALQAIGAFCALLAVTATIVCVLSHPLDQRMVYILNGLSRCVAAVVLAMFSVRVALWLGLYREYRHGHADAKRQHMGTTVQQLQHAVRWSVAKKFLRPYCVLLLLFGEGAGEGVSVPASILAGIVTGLAVDFLIYKCRRLPSARTRWYVSLALVTSLGLVSIFCLAVGAFFIASVWDDNVQDDDVSKTHWDAWALGIGFAVLPLLHLVVWQWGKHAAAKATDSHHPTLESLQSTVSADTYKTRMVMSMIFSRRAFMQDEKNQTSTQNDYNAAMSSNLDQIMEEVEQQQQQQQNQNDDENDNRSANSSGSEKYPTPSPTQGLSTEEEGDESPGISTKSQEEEEADEKEGPKDSSKSDVPTKSSEEGEANESIDHDAQLEDHEVENGVEESYSAPAFLEEHANKSPRPPTTMELWMDWQFCGCIRGDDKPRSRKVYNCFVWTLYLFVYFLCFFVVIVNIGATRQQEAVRDKLPYVSKKLYRTMDYGPVCAFDNRGADSNITTFASQQEAHEAGFLILHCGACAACSDWHNLELEYTTRNFLALESRKCAQKTLFGGGRDDLIECLESDRIGFQGECAVCWADDILCTKDFCAFIAVQSFLINTLANFEVGPDTITAAACEEAHCEAGNPGDFVACSGATRRRMNVTSSIKRPGSQRCGIVDVDWQELFPDPHPNDT